LEACWKSEERPKAKKSRNLLDKGLKASVMSKYFILSSAKCIFFAESDTIYPMSDSKPIFSKGKHIKDIDSEWLKCLSNEDQKIINKYTKEYENNKINTI
jgi:hypothetical protein